MYTPTYPGVVMVRRFPGEAIITTISWTGGDTRLEVLNNDELWTCSSIFLQQNIVKCSMEMSSSFQYVASFIFLTYAFLSISYLCLVALYLPAHPPIYCIFECYSGILHVHGEVNLNQIHIQ